MLFNKFCILSLLWGLTIPLVNAQFPELKSQQEEVKNEIAEVLNLTNQNPDNSQTAFLLSLARNYYQLDDYRKAEKFYLQVIDQNICSPLDYKALALCLAQNDKKSLADEFYRIYAKEGQASSFNQLWLTSDKAVSKHSRTREKKLTNFEFIYGNLNPDGSTSLNIDHGTVTANVGCNSFINMSAITLPIAEFTSMGSFTNGASNHYFYSYKNANGKYGLYSVSVKNGNWSKTKKIVFDQEDANYVYPFFANGTLYFCSDRSGGFGKYDIYQAQWNGKSLENVTNLGAFINTDKNEILPSVVNGQFSFSSNGLPGHGGYDIYYSDWSFLLITSEKYPYNSKQNDFLIIDSRQESAAVIKEVGGKTNVYLIEKYYDYDLKLIGTVRDEDGKEVADARILIAKASGGNGHFTTTNLDGEFSITVPDTINDWRIEVIKSHFVSKQFQLSLSTLGNNPLVISIARVAAVEPETVFIVNSPSRYVIPSEPETEVDSTDGADNDEKDDIFNEVNHDGQYYIIYASSRSYKGAYKFWQEWAVSFPDSEILKNEEKGIYRVGTYAGMTKKEAMAAYRKAKHVKSDAWILRPDQH